MQDYDTILVVFYSAPSRVGAGMPFALKPEEALQQSFDANEDDVFAKAPPDAFAFRLVPVFTETINKGLADLEKTTKTALTSMPLCFMGGTHLKADRIKALYDPRSKKARALKELGTEFVFTNANIMVPFTPDHDVVLQKMSRVWEQIYP